MATQTRHARSLQSDLYRASTQVFASVENRFRQLVRQVATELGREVKFELEGGALEIDRVHLENLNGPLSHLLRNAIVHGIETTDEREQFGRSARIGWRCAITGWRRITRHESFAARVEA